MVFLDSFTMTSPREHQSPSPPTVEQILEDLSAANDEDVVFKSPIVAEHATQTNKVPVVASHSKLDENATQQTLGGKEQMEKKGNTEEANMEGQSNEQQLYAKVASFLEQFKSLETEQEQLKSLEGDLKSKKEGLEEAISRVETAWKVDKTNTE